MKLVPIIALSVGIPLTIHAQEAPGQSKSQPTKIIGDIADGKLSPSPEPRTLPEFKIDWSTVHQKKDHKVIINKVQAPAQLVQHPTDNLSVEEIAQRREELEKWVQETKPPGGVFTVSATIYDQKTTYVRWWHKGEEYAAWSNVNWNHLGGFHEFEGRGKQYSMILFSGNVGTKEGRSTGRPEIPNLPPLLDRGAAYMVVEGNEQNDEAMEFIEAIHDLYDEHRPELMKAWNERKKNHLAYLKQQEELKNNPPPKPDVTINYWKKKTPIEGKEGK